MNDRHPSHLLTYLGIAASGFGAVVSQYLPTLLGLAATLFGVWLQRRERQATEAQHERHMRERMGLPPFRPAEACTDSPE